VNPDVDAYVERSTGWPAEIAELRPILLDAGLTEEIKWAKPCYSHGGHNVAIVQEMKGFLALMFFDGALLADPEGILVDQGPNSRSAKRMELTSVDDVRRHAATITAYLAEAMAARDAGLKVGPAPEPELVEELQARLDGDPALRTAFEALTPGRRREYNLHIAAAKRAGTRESRVDACSVRILASRGLRDR
jgi:uncharacterized protein YdeI (YjbR/CyaY-like superfamily)